MARNFPHEGHSTKVARKHRLDMHLSDAGKMHMFCMQERSPGFLLYSVVRISGSLYISESTPEEKDSESS